MTSSRPTIGVLALTMLNLAIVFYELFLIVGTVLSCLVPFIIFKFQKPGWRVPG